MIGQFFQVVVKKIQLLLYPRRKWAIILLLLAFCVSCSSAKPPEVELKISAKSTSRSGSYIVTGSTNLPEHSRITVAALRYLRSTNQQFLSSNSNVTYSILDRRVVEVAQGKWQTPLELWQVAPDGRLQESWQLKSSQIGLSLSPTNDVSFVATFDPAGQFYKPEQQQVQPQDLQGTFVRFTSDGLPYVRASQTLKVSLPVGRRQPPGLKPEDINGCWGNRYQLKPQPLVAKTIRPQLPETKQTNAPLSPSEFLR